MVQADFFRSRSHIPNGVKAKSWADRMEKTKKERAIKKLETEMKEEKQAEITRCVYHGPIGFLQISNSILGGKKSQRSVKRLPKKGED